MTSRQRLLAALRLEQPDRVPVGTASGTYTERGARNFMALVEVAREYGRA